MGNKNSAQIQIKTDKATYYPGDTINAVVFINAPKQHFCSKIVLHIEGYEESEFRSDQGDRELLNSQTTLIRTFCVLKNFHSAKSFLEGQYEFPCTFVLPWVIPGSFDETKGNYTARIVYQMKCILVAPSGKKENFQKIQEIIVREKQREIDGYQMGKVTITPESCFSKNLGVCEVKCWFQKKNYLPNDDCNVICEVDNSRSKKPIKRIKCEFMRTIKLRATNGVTKTIKDLLNTVEFDGAEKGQCLVGPLAQRVNIPLTYKLTSTGIHPSTTGQLIRCEYSIEVTPEVGGCFTKGNKTFVVNLQILHPQIEQNIQKPEEWKPVVGTLSRINLSSMNDSEMKGSVGVDLNQFAAE